MRREKNGSLNGLVLLHLKTTRYCICICIAGLDTDTLTRISRLLDRTKWRLFGETLGFSNEALETLEKSNQKSNLKIYTMLGAWRNTKPFNCDKILAISSALLTCGQEQLAWEICRGKLATFVFGFAKVKLYRG